MSIPDPGEATLSTRLLIALACFAVLAALAAVGMMFSMMMALFSADAGTTGDTSDGVFERAAFIMASALAFAVVLPPLMLLLRAPWGYAAVPAVGGFALAGATLLWYVARNLGGTG